jgi:DNA mismatch repair protein MutS
MPGATDDKPALRLVADDSDLSEAGGPPSRAPSKPKNDPRATPAMRQYYAFKERHPDCVLFFRMGDFYEMFDDDAIAAHKALGITLTERTAGVPMAGVPYHSVEGYLKRMLEKGFRVAVCEQVQDPREAKGVVERAVARVLTPGTLVDENLLDSAAHCNLACVCFLDAGDSPDVRVACAIVEVSTGRFTLFDCAARDLADELSARSVTELLYADTADGAPPPRIERLCNQLRASRTPRPAWQFRAADALDALRKTFGVRTLAGFGLSDDDASIPAAGAIAWYLTETQLPGESAGARTLAHLQPPKRDDATDSLRIDSASLRSLEVERTIRDGATSHSLLGVFLDGAGSGGCKTAMGKRLLRDWLCRPLASRKAIESRHARVAALVSDRRAARELAEALGKVQDVARIAGRVSLGRATPRDIVALGRSLSVFDAMLEPLANAPAFADARAELEKSRDALAPLSAAITERCVDAAPHHLREGGLFKDSVDAELDECRSLERDATEWLARYQGQLVAKHDLPGLKVSFNKVFGYYIELPRGQAKRAPDEFSRKQTLKNAERYTTPELKEFEDKVLTARDRAIAREQFLFDGLCERVNQRAREIARFADVAAELDALACFAEKAARRGWVRPEMRDEPTLSITQGRHPVLEATLGQDFVPNDASLATDDQQASLALITGPNMAGKSTYIRMVALIALLAHAGSFVPADAATIGVCDRIFTRVGADDALHAGQSTFMVEMTETANILHNATPRSLVILDEIGRGTSTLDGLSLAWAIAERLAAGNGQQAAGHTSSGPRTLFATHYHELTQLEEQLQGRVTNLHVAVREWKDEIVFLHRILPGRTDRSYGVHVARLAGLPSDVIARARQLLESLAVSHEGAPPARPPRREPEPRPQLALFREHEPHPALDELRSLDLNAMTPLQAFDALRRLADLANGG